jgi:hypothetical protein
MNVISQGSGAGRMKISVKTLALAFTVVVYGDILLASPQAAGQWVGPDPNVISTETLAKALSPAFIQKATATLDALDAVSSEAGKAWEAADAAKVLAACFNDLAKENKNPIEKLFLKNFSYRVLEVQTNNAYLTAAEIGESPLHQSEAGRKMVTDYKRLSVEVERECTKDLRMRISGKINLKCQESLNQLTAQFPAGWIGATSSVSEPIKHKPDLSTDAQNDINAVLNALDNYIDSVKEDAQQENGADALEALIEIMKKDNTETFDKFIFTSNVLVRRTITRMDAQQYDQDQGDLKSKLYKDHLALAADKACVNDIRERMEGGEDAACSRLTNELYHLLSY